MNCYELNKQLAMSNSGKGTTMLTPHETSKLVKVGEGADLFIVTIEVYELRGEMEIPRLDLSLYNVCNEEGIRNLPTLEKKKACRSAFDHMIKLIENEKKLFGLRVWLED